MTLYLKKLDFILFITFNIDLQKLINKLYSVIMAFVIMQK